MKTKSGLGAALLFASIQVVAATLSSVLSAAVAKADCAANTKDVVLKSSLGSASSWSNLRSSAGSLKQESKVLMEEAQSGLKNAKAPDGLCGDGCSAVAVPLMVFQSTPNKFLDSYSDSAQCNDLFAKSKKSPFHYDGKKFASLDELNSWFGDFSQGKGTDGSDLYEKCPGSCSPQYTNVITQKGTTYLVNAEAVCGPARDKSDNQYKLSVAYRWSCEAKK